MKLLVFSSPKGHIQNGKKNITEFNAIIFEQ